MLVCVALVSGCATSTKNVYDSADVGRVISTSGATVLASRVVSITEQPGGYGPLAGAAVGATASGATIGSGRGSAVAAALGGLLGAGLGYIAEQAVRTREGIEYVIRTPDGRTQTLVQNRDPDEAPIAAGTTVLVQNAGNYTRIIEMPQAVQEPWKDPDAASGSDAPGGAAAGSGAPARSSPDHVAAPSQSGPGSTPPLPSPPRRYGTVRPVQ